MKSQSLLLLRSAKIGDYLALMKPRVMMLVVFTAVVGMILAPAALAPFKAILSILCIALGAGASGVLNMWYDRDIDDLMARTAGRPIPTGRVTPANAMAFGLVLAVGSITLLGLAANWLAAFLLALTIAYYIFIYTAWLKRRTTQSVVIGGVAGALPPMIGWVAATGSIDAGAMVLFGIIFLWTPPHSWALVFFKGGEFAKAGLPVLRGEQRTRRIKRQAFVYSLLLFPMALMPGVLGIAGPAYLAIAGILGTVFVVMTWRLLATSDGQAAETARRARALFEFSILYMALIFSALLIDHSAPALLSAFAG